MDADIPALLGTDILDKESLTPCTVSNRLVKHVPHKKADGKEVYLDEWPVPVIRSSNNHLYAEMNLSEAIFLTRTQLCRLHRQFLHPSAQKLFNVLKRSLPDEAGTTFRAARFLPDVSTDSIWKSMFDCWACIYTSLPNRILTGQETQFGEKFINLACIADVEVNRIGIEAHASLSLGERYREPLRPTFRKIKSSQPGIDKLIALVCSVKAMNDSLGPEGLVPSALVFGEFLRIRTVDIRQAYLQASEPLEGDVFIGAPAPEFELSPEPCLKLLRPLYGRCDAGDLWHTTLDKHYCHELKMKPFRTNARCIT